MLLFVGLGNPGPRYARHRHNIGFMAVEAIVRRHGFGRWQRAFEAETAEGRIGGEKVICLKPQTFMNESGRAVGAALRYFKLPTTALTVFHDELDLAPGKLRVKHDGGAGGHNGLRSIDAHVGKDYWRVRMGIGHPGHKDAVHGYVLHDFAKTDNGWLDKELDVVADEAERLVANDGPGFMSKVALVMNPPRPRPTESRPTGPKTPKPSPVDPASAPEAPAPEKENEN